MLDQLSPAYPAPQLKRRRLFQLRQRDGSCRSYWPGRHRYRTLNAATNRSARYALYPVVPVPFPGLTELSNCIYAEYAGEGEETWLGFVVRFFAGFNAFLVRSGQAMEVIGAQWIHGPLQRDLTAAW